MVLFSVSLGEKVSKEIVEEIREVRQRDKLALRRMKEIELYKHRKMQQMQLAQQMDSIRHQMAKYEQEMHMLQEKRHLLENERLSLKEFNNKIFHDSSNEYIDDSQLTDHYYHLSKNYEDVMRRLDISRMKHTELMQHMAVLDQQLSHSMKILE